MTTLQSLILAVALVSAAILVGLFSRYSMTEGVDHGGVLITHRLDRLTGQVYYCAVPDKGLAPICSPIAGSF
jgi:hypothetical protein